MSYKTILVHCNDRRRIEKLLAPAASLAEMFQAHLIGLSVVPPVVIVPAPAALGPPVIVDAHCELYRAENPAMQAAFEAATRGRGFVAEWRDDDAGAFGVADCLLPYAHAADLVVASQTDRAWPGSDRLDIADRLAMESGRPVLIVPNAGVHSHVGERVLVAWNGRREAARASFDALPILRGAKTSRWSGSIHSRSANVRGTFRQRISARRWQDMASSARQPSRLHPAAGSAKR